jgi:hypothetical protein
LGDAPRSERLVPDMVASGWKYAWDG